MKSLKLRKRSYNKYKQIHSEVKNFFFVNFVKNHIYKIIIISIIIIKLK